MENVCVNCCESYLVGGSLIGCLIEDFTEAKSLDDAKVHTCTYYNFSSINEKSKDES